MDRDVAQMILTKINAIKTGLQKLATNSAPVDPALRSVYLNLDEQNRTLAEEPDELEEQQPVIKEKN